MTFLGQVCLKLKPNRQTKTTDYITITTLYLPVVIEKLKVVSVDMLIAVTGGLSHRSSIKLLVYAARPVGVSHHHTGAKTKLQCLVAEHKSVIGNMPRLLCSADL